MSLASLQSLRLTYEGIEALANLSEVAYLPHPQNVLPSQYSVTVCAKDGVDALVVSDEQTCVVAFRGTDRSFREWWRNFTATPHPLAPGLCHEGFYDGVDGIFHDLLETLTGTHQALTPTSKGLKRIFLTGDSQGGALAGILACFFMPAKCLGGICTFNAPAFAGPRECRGLNRRLKRYGNQGQGADYLRVVFSNDLISRIPIFFRRPSCPLLPSRQMFGRAGSLAHLREDGSILVSPSSWRLFCRRVADFRMDFLRDHSIEKVNKVLSCGNRSLSYSG